MKQEWHCLACRCEWLSHVIQSFFRRQSKCFPRRRLVRGKGQNCHSPASDAGEAPPGSRAGGCQTGTMPSSPKKPVPTGPRMGQHNWDPAAPYTGWNLCSSRHCRDILQGPFLFLIQRPFDKWEARETSEWRLPAWSWGLFPTQESWFASRSVSASVLVKPLGKMDSQKTCSHSSSEPANLHGKENKWSPPFIHEIHLPKVWYFEILCQAWGI